MSNNQLKKIMFKVQKNLIYNIKLHRKKLKLTQEQFAELCGVSANYIGKVEIGYHFPSPEILDKMAEILHIEPYELFIDVNNFSNLNKEEIKLKKELITKNLIKDIEDIIKKYLNNNDL